MATKKTKTKLATETGENLEQENAEQSGTDLQEQEQNENTTENEAEQNEQENTQEQENTTETQEPIFKKEDFVKELYTLLKDNAKWVEQVKMSLFVVSHLYEAFVKIEGSYDTSLKECKKYADEVKTTFEKCREIEGKINEHYKELQEKAADFEARIETQAGEIEALHKDCGYIKHEIEVYYTEIENFKIKLELFKEEFTQKEQELLKELESFKSEFEANKTELLSLINQANDDLLAFKAQVNIEKEAFNTQAEAKKEELDTLLEGKKEEILEELKNSDLTQNKETLEGIYAHLFSIERVLIEKGVVNLGEVTTLPLGQGEQEGGTDLQEQGEQTLN